MTDNKNTTMPAVIVGESLVFPDPRPGAHGAKRPDLILQVESITGEFVVDRDGIHCEFYEVHFAGPDRWCISYERALELKSITARISRRARLMKQATTDKRRRARSAACPCWAEMIAMQPHQQRVLAEKEALDDKIEKLDNFVEGGIFPGLPIDERNDMDLQLGAMKLYSRMLESRISRF